MKQTIIFIAALTVSFAAFASGTVSGSATVPVANGIAVNQTQAQSTNTASNSQANSAIGQGSNIGNTVFNTESARFPTATAIAPAIVSSNDTCMGSSSAGISTVSIGISMGTTCRDDNCVMLKNSRELWNMGLRNAAVARMCMDTENSLALEVTGVTCPDFDAARAKRNSNQPRTNTAMVPVSAN
jgi:hypothetical protein